MQRSNQLAKNYAQALLEITNNDVKEQDLILSELLIINDSMSKVSKAKEVFSSPAFSKETKKELLKNLFNGKINQKVLNLLYVLVDNQRFNVLSNIQEQFQRLVNMKKGTVQAEVISAHPLDTDTIETLKQQLERILNSENITLETKTEPALLGGIKIKVNDLVYDGSIKGRLEGLKRTFKN